MGLPLAFDAMFLILGLLVAIAAQLRYFYRAISEVLSEV
jgi:hypothetical protein